MKLTHNDTLDGAKIKHKKLSATGEILDNEKEILLGLKTIILREKLK